MNTKVIKLAAGVTAIIAIAVIGHYADATPAPITSTQPQATHRYPLSTPNSTNLPTPSPTTSPISVVKAPNVEFSTPAPTPSPTATPTLPHGKCANGVEPDGSCIDPGYVEYCPDGTPSQGSCETPAGAKGSNVCYDKPNPDNDGIYCWALTVEPNPTAGYDYYCNYLYYDGTENYGVYVETLPDATEGLSCN